MKSVLSDDQVAYQAQAYRDWGGSFNAWCESKDFWPGDIVKILEYLRARVK